METNSAGPPNGHSQPTDFDPSLNTASSFRFGDPVHNNSLFRSQFASPPPVPPQSFYQYVHYNGQGNTQDSDYSAHDGDIDEYSQSSMPSTFMSSFQSIFSRSNSYDQLGTPHIPPPYGPQSNTPHTMHNNPNTQRQPLHNSTNSTSQNPTSSAPPPTATANQNLNQNGKRVCPVQVVPVPGLTMPQSAKRQRTAQGARRIQPTPTSNADTPGTSSAPPPPPPDSSPSAEIPNGYHSYRKILVGHAPILTKSTVATDIYYFMRPLSSNQASDFIPPADPDNEPILKQKPAPGPNAEYLQCKLCV
jgi:hypothetical protein